jgi:hypothetical protein
VARVVQAQRQAVAFLHFGDQVVGLDRQATGVEREDLDVQAVANDQIGEHHVFGAEAAGEGRWREGVGDLAQQAARLTRRGRRRRRAAPGRRD